MAIFSPYQTLISIAPIPTKNMDPIAGQVVIRDFSFFIVNLFSDYREDRARLGKPIMMGFFRT
jgi:hypothetical protein